MIRRRTLILGTAATTLGLTTAGAFSNEPLDLRLHSNAPIGDDVWDLARRELRNISELQGRVVNIVFLGQSTNNNCIPGRLAVANERAIFNLSLAHPMRTAIYQAKEPLLVSDVQEGHHGMDLADELINQGLCDQVILTPVACGGSFAADYAPGGGIVHQEMVRTGVLSYRIGLAARSIAFAGLHGIPTVVDWQQGEWDSDNEPTSYQNYRAALVAVINECRRVGLVRDGNAMFIHRCTRPTNTEVSREPIRRAQIDVVDGRLVLAGADVDEIGSEYRYDGTHFNRAGAAVQARLKLPHYVDFLQRAFSS